MFRAIAWSVVVCFPLCLLSGCSQEGTPASNVKKGQPEKGKKTGNEPGPGKNSASVTD
jgi:hypothetical protein